MLFRDSKYCTWYFSIIENSKNRELPSVVEKHHIIPKSLGGKNGKSNIAHLTPREHFLCHKLLVRMTEGKDRRKMSYALWTMTRNNPYQKRRINATDYEIARNLYVENHPSKFITEERREQIRETFSKANKGRKKGYNNFKKINDDVTNGIRDNPRTKWWKVIDPEGNEFTIKNLNQYCKEKGLSMGNLTYYGHTKGYKVIDLGPCQN